MKKEITFILPTMNRRQYVTRAVESCLAVESQSVKAFVLIIDGKSDDGTWELLSQTYANDPRVTLVQRDRIGFQRTAYYGVSLVKTEYAAYMYDDDVLSPYYGQMVARMLELDRGFVMGYGRQHPIDQVREFQSVAGKVREAPKYELALTYYGSRKAGSYAHPPESPICCVVKTEHLRNWVRFSQDYARNVPIRQYYMIDRNIGPDLIIYLSSILSEPQTVLLADEVIAQFSEHPASMSVGYGATHLQTGYWLGKLWGCERICAQGRSDVAARCAAYLLLIGYLVAFKMLFAADRRWLGAFLKELFKLKHLIIAQSLTWSVLRGCVVSIRDLLRRPKEV